MSLSDTRLLARPLYLQVRDILVQKIIGGDWKPGSSLPNETLLAQQLGISIGTVRKALDMMESEHIVTRRQGRGTFVNDYSQDPILFSSFISGDGKAISCNERGKQVSREAANHEEAFRLGIATGDEVIRVERIRVHRGQPFLTEVCLLPARLFKSLPDDMTTYRLSALAQRNSIIVGNANEEVSLTAASPSDALDLNVDEGTPLIALDRVIHSEGGHRLEWRRGRCFLRNERFVVRYN